MVSNQSMFLPELLALTLQYLCEDIPTLKSCALVCRNWLHPSRDHLFSTVCVTDSSPGHTFKAFARFLAQSPGVWHCIRNLTLQGHSPQDEVHSMLRGRRLRKRRPIDITLLVSFLQKLRRLRVLSLKVLKIDLDAPLSSLPHQLSLDGLALELVGCTEDRANNILGFLSLFSDIDRLLIASPHWNIETLDNSELAQELERVPLPTNLRVRSINLELLPKDTVFVCGRVCGSSRYVSLTKAGSWAI
ncbi:hypothetical protein C8Q75DRAFT_496463 [Abortiporus biennis]|nr:hypothetical protein C8Q75DRAFT_496463 [Abortiporus biennis]